MDRTPELRGEIKPLLTVSHLDRSLMFYPDVFGLTVAHKSHPGAVVAFDPGY